jgi:hypothetical protein
LTHSFLPAFWWLASNNIVTVASTVLLIGNAVSEMGGQDGCQRLLEELGGAGGTSITGFSCPDIDCAKSKTV